LEPNFTGIMLRRSSTRIPLFVLIGQNKWQIYAFLFSIGQEKKIFPLKILYQLESIFPGMIFIRIFVLIFGSLIFGFNLMNL